MDKKIAVEICAEDNQRRKIYEAKGMMLSEFESFKDKAIKIYQRNGYLDVEIPKRREFYFETSTLLIDSFTILDIEEDLIEIGRGKSPLIDEIFKVVDRYAIRFKLYEEDIL